MNGTAPTPPSARDHARSSRVERDACGIGFVAEADGRPSRRVVDLALEGLAGVSHRGAVAADGLSGDGAGLLVAMPHAFVARVAAEARGSAAGAGTGSEARPVEGRIGVLTLFADAADAAARAEAVGHVERAVAGAGLELFAWREVPIDEEQLGAVARAERPAVLQAFVTRAVDHAAGSPDGTDADGGLDAAERRVWRARLRAEDLGRAAGVRLYVAGASFRTLVYKALVTSDRLGRCYPDLRAPDFVAPHAVFHSRFSTNTHPSWERAQPFRTLCHNGEINTLAGNERHLAARGDLGTEAVGLGSPAELGPIVDPFDSDSGKLDSVVELLVHGGRDVRHAVAMLVPEAWEGRDDLPPGVEDFFRYHSCLTEPWDGPAGLVFTDGRTVGAALDRNGLRPLRWQVTGDGLVVCSSEAGAVPVEGHGEVRRGRLGPGQMMAVDPASGGIQHDVAIKTWLAGRAPYGTWVRDGLRPGPAGSPIVPDADDDSLVAAQVTFGVSKEEVAMVLKPIASEGKEPTFAMGDDTPFAAVATKRRPAFDYLRQRFAQVSNPAIDHLRERAVTSLRTLVGPRSPLLGEEAEAAHLLEFPTAVVYPDAVGRLLDPERSPFPAATLDGTFEASDGPGGLRAAVERLAGEAVDAVAGGAGLLVVTDAGAGPERVPVPSLLAAGAVHHALVAAGDRHRASIVVDSGDARDTHALACLIGFGADLVCPRLALATVAALADDEQLGGVDAFAAQDNLCRGLEDGLLKIMAKMGIATLDGYRGAQIFEVLGLAPEVVELCLRGTASPVPGIGFTELGEDLLAWHGEAYGSGEPALDEPGIVRFRKRAGEYHGHHPDVIAALHESVGLTEPAAAAAGERAFTHLTVTAAPPAGPDGDGGADSHDDDCHPDPAETRAAHFLQAAVRTGDADLYRRFSEMVAARPTTELHDLLEPVPAGEPIPVDDVEPVTSITRRFSTGAMSHGSISAEAHETLAVAMNMVGGKSNCGEGGEDPDRFRTRGAAVDRNSRIKQIASGRFGVTPQYCAFADELQIKIAQGSKPGEGGQLPGHKVTAEIARLRHTQPGVGLISPPPHHDIYSIEDLAQLVYDLKQVNPLADVSVKLVAESGVGTIAAGVAKALADVVQISGHNGGTGASPLSSIKHAGMPWELGLAETQRVLVDQGLRGRVRVRVDGGLLTGQHVVMAALLGADEFSFGTGALLAEGCIMVRACHRDTCPTGIATQRPNLRAKFAGTPEGVASYMLFVAEEVRTLLASLGLRSIDEAVGRVDLIRRRTVGERHADALDLSVLFEAPDADPGEPRSFRAAVPVQRPRSRLDETLLADAFRALWDGEDQELDYEITNADRSVGASLGGAIGLEWGDRVPPATVTARFTGSAGQSFGAFVSDGMHLVLTGEANDYLGKGMGGGRIVVKAPPGDAGEPVLAGNTVLYGSTGGQVFVAGRVGERCAVRNSGALAVVEGTGDHACEYMTGGTVVILGSVGRNLGAGMTGGQAFVWDPDGRLEGRLNRQLVESSRLGERDEPELRYTVEMHAALTGSERARALLGDWEAARGAFRRVAPVDEVGRADRASQGALGASR